MKETKNKIDCASTNEPMNRMGCDCDESKPVKSAECCETMPAKADCDHLTCDEAQVEECKIEAHIKGTCVTRTRKRSSWK